MKHYKYKEYIANVFPCIYYGTICGSVTGALIFLFKLAAKKIEELSRALYASAKSNPIYIAIIFAVLIVCALLMYLLHKKVPESRGGGIPRSEGVLRGVLSFRWFKTLIATFVGSMMSFFCGLPLGSEGPAVLMGTSIGKMCSNISKNKTTWNRYIMTGGAGAGFAVATGAPLSGILFALEEIHKRFTPMLVLAVSMSVISATYVNQLLCSAFDISANLFHIDAFAEFKLSHIGYLLLLGVLVAVAVAIFDSSIDFFGNLTKKIKFLTAPVKLIIVFIVTGIWAFCFEDALYSGHHTIEHVLINDKTALLLFGIFAIRLIMMLFITDSGVTGGIFIPTLAIGAAFSALAAKLLLVIGLDESLFPAVVFLGMCAFIGGTLRAPLTSAVLFLELTGQFSNMLFVALVIFTVTFITEMINQTPFYDHALESMEHIQNQGKEPIIAHFEMTVSHNSFVVGKAVRDIMWPSSSVVVSIKRADETKKDMDNDGEKKLYVGDTLVLRAKFFDEDEIRKLLVGLVGKDHEITRITLE
ncbi:MAG: chloride channel protein [Clostridia bacterium]|nr:chloride channel protein [Clostridia bacterium]